MLQYKETQYKQDPINVFGYLDIDKVWLHAISNHSNSVICYSAQKLSVCKNYTFYMVKI